MWLLCRDQLFTLICLQPAAGKPSLSPGLGWSLSEGPGLPSSCRCLRLPRTFFPHYTLILLPPQSLYLCFQIVDRSTRHSGLSLPIAALPSALNLQYSAHVACCLHRSTDSSSTRFRSNSYPDPKPSGIGGLPYTYPHQYRPVETGAVSSSNHSPRPTSPSPVTFNSAKIQPPTTCWAPGPPPSSSEGASQHRERERERESSLPSSKFRRSSPFTRPTPLQKPP